mmetsp:Transcript_80179/g.158839  ORF Transcript_80179/g.158839 Transcript_80179/m.158839 type:complete len:222 (+) Transcript_80179:38-703(+)
MVLAGNHGLDVNGKTDANSELPETATAGPTSSGGLRAEDGVRTPRTDLSKKRRPCKGCRNRYRRLVAATASQIEADPAIFDMDELEIRLPAMVKKHPHLKQKFMRRMDNMKQQSLAKQNTMHVSTMVELQDGRCKALAERSTSEEKAPNGFIEPKRVVLGKQDRQKQHPVIETDKVRPPVQVVQGKGYDVPAMLVMTPRVEDIALPIRLLCRRATITDLGA